MATAQTTICATTVVNWLAITAAIVWEVGIMSAEGDEPAPEAIASSAETMAQRALKRVRELEAELGAAHERIDDVEAENDRLRAELEEIDERTGLMEAVSDASSMQIETRAAVCIQTLVNEASAVGGEDLPTAAMDWNEGRSALGGSISRTSVYDTFDKAQELVDSRLGEEQDVVKYISEDRSSPRNSRLVVNLDAGDVPGKLGDKEIQHGGNAT